LKGDGETHLLRSINPKVELASGEYESPPKRRTTATRNIAHRTSVRAAARVAAMNAALANERAARAPSQR
jgi:hypothetical protein